MAARPRSTRRSACRASAPASAPTASSPSSSLLMPFVVFALWLLLRRTRFGLQLAACGEHPFAARSVGVEPPRMRLIALSSAACSAGSAGRNWRWAACGFSHNMTAGRGFMAFAAVIFGAGHPFGVAAAALFFAIVGATRHPAQLISATEFRPRSF